MRLKSTITTLATPTSIIDAEVAFIQLYPNPIKTVLNIQCQEAIIERVVIYNTMGSCIYVEACNQNYANVAAGNWSKGIYFVSIYINGKPNTYKVIKE